MAWWTRKPRPKARVPELDRLLRAWHLSMRYHEFHEGAKEPEIAATEQALSVRLPTVCRAIYEMSNGLALCECNIVFDALNDIPGGLSVIAMNAMFRKYHPSFPNEAIFFGGNGSDDHYALWIPGRTKQLHDCPVIATAEMQDSIAIVGTSLINFLIGRTANYLLLEADTSRALGALGLPPEMQTDDPGEGHYEKITNWADPTLPDPHPDPFQRPVSVEQLRSIYGSA